MATLKPELLDKMAQLEVEALLEGLNDEDLRRSPAFLEKVRKFLQQNKLITQPETAGVNEIEREVTKIPDFDPFDVIEGGKR